MLKALLWYLQKTYLSQTSSVSCSLSIKVILHTYVDLSAFADLTSQSTLYVGGSIDSVISYQGKIACLEFYDMQLTAVQVQKIIQRCRNNADQFKGKSFVKKNLYLLSV